MRGLFARAIAESRAVIGAPAATVVESFVPVVIESDRMLSLVVDVESARRAVESTRA